MTGHVKNRSTRFYALVHRRLVRARATIPARVSAAVALSFELGQAPLENLREG
jgi:hypothetical protein